ncbi:hypothetical protein [Glycomyces buryatensis]|uniref:hypothetical protein n=1 Tax=Glycomyces buryatensis TaxID=2570927 RepID=UPI001B3C168E|nr:hypothetical protein [Glycomyces buryatensis]
MISQISFDMLLEIQREAEANGWSTRWSSEAALRDQVKPGSIVLAPLLRECRGETVRTYRCLIVFESPEGESSGSMVTIDLSPARFASLTPLACDSPTRDAFARMFSLALGGISMVSKT